MLRNTLMLMAGSALLVGANEGPRASRAPTADVTITSSPNTAVRIIAPATASVRLHGEPGTGRGDTLLARTPIRFTASLAGSDVRIESVDGATVDLVATLQDGAAWRLGGSGRTLLLRAGGREIHVPR